ncbi:hypothetical protein NLI96_g1945 [Meripilus lineatus]|uniref:Integrase catalytic domain-containing protein n=1 Tax=Meripilus lineatus TaxID=2056292 RepID=A0AAD5V9N9_9APHY|nr:hypothetical protein NLI96_g1945 [Physisporinus lineatus]
MLVKREELKPGSLVEGKPTTDESSAILLALEPDQRTHIVGLEDDPVAIWRKLEMVHLKQGQDQPTASITPNFSSIQEFAVDSTHTAYLSGHVAIPSLTPVQLAHLSSASTLPQDLSLWHRCPAHHHYQGVKTLISKGLATGIKLDSAAAPDLICEPCLSGKMHAYPFPTTNTVTPRLLGLVHSDLHGPLRCQTHSGFRYWITFIDDRSKFKAAIPLRAKSEAFLAFKRYRAYAMTKHNLEIGALQDDKGDEYMSKEFDNFCADHGIVRRHTVRNRPQQNDVAERFNRLLNESITTMLAESNLPMQFWGEALATFIHIHNRCSTSSLPNTTPFEMWEGSKPDLSHLRVWGCTAYVHVQKDKRSSSLGSHMENVRLGLISQSPGQC